ncbi:MAG: hypothetical protein ACRDD4_12515, partial [Culicoidibacterales bacterium]
MYTKSQEMKLTLTVNGKPEVLAESIEFAPKFETETADVEVNDHVNKKVVKRILTKSTTSGITGQILDTDDNVIATLFRKMYVQEAVTLEGIPYEFEISAWDKKLSGTCSISLNGGSASNGEPMPIEFDITFETITVGTIGSTLATKKL